MPRRRRRIRRKALRAAIQPPIRHLHRHEQQVSVDRHIALSPRADQRRQQLGLRRIGNVIDANAVEIPLEKVVSLKCKIRIRVCQLRDHRFQRRRHLRCVAHAQQLQRLVHLRVSRRGRIQSESSRLLQEEEVLHPHRRLARVVHSRLQRVALVVRIGSRHPRRQRRSRLRRELIHLICGRRLRGRFRIGNLRRGGLCGGRCRCRLLRMGQTDRKHQNNRNRRHKGQAGSHTFPSHRLSTNVFYPACPA